MLSRKGSIGFGVTRFWHPVSDMHAVQASGELILERGEGCHLWDEVGNRYIDSTGGLWYANVGYGRSEIADAAAAQMRKLHAYSHYGDVSSRPTTDLAERISRIAPMADAAVFFTSGGGESIETIVKLVRRYWSLVDQPDRTVIISRERAYHGLAGYGTSIVGTEAFKVGVGPLAGDTARVAWDSAEALEATILELGPSGWRLSSASRSSAPAGCSYLRTATSRLCARSAARTGSSSSPTR